VAIPGKSLVAMPPTPAQELAEKTHLMAREECRAIGRALAAKRRIHPAIHEARKGIRRLRALLALVAHRVPEAGKIDLSLEKLGDGLSLPRDAHVVVDTARRISVQHRKRWKPAIEALTALRDARLGRLLAADPGFLKRRALLRRLEAQLEFLDWSKLRLDDFKTGIDDSQRRVASAEKRAAVDPTPENTHRWRRRVRRLRFQLEALGKVSPNTLNAFSRKHPGRDPKALHKLGDALGDRRDEQMLESALKRMPGLSNRTELMAQLKRAKPPAPKPMAPRSYPEPLLLPPQAEREIVG
jgi:CHAD domain-containing protein